MNWAFILKVGAKVFGYLLKQVTPIIKESLEEQLTQIYIQALDTPNPFDDHLMAMVLEILDIGKPAVLEKN